MDDAHLLTLWLQGRARNTDLSYRRQLGVFQAFLKGRPLLSATVTDLQDYGHSVQGGRLGLASQYVALSAVQSLYAFALEIGEIERDPARALRLPKPRDGLAQRIVSVEEIRRLMAAAKGRLPTFTKRSYTALEALRLLGVQPSQFWALVKSEGWKRTRSPDPYPLRHGAFLARDLAKVVDRCPPFRDYVLCRFLYETGARISEALGVRWPDFSADRNGEAVVTVFGKGSRTRTVRIGPAVWRLVQQLREGGTPDGFVFRTSWRGSHAIGRENFTRTMWLVAKLAGLDVKVSAHWLRHAHASHALDGGCAIHVLQANLGHASLMSTERYLHVRPGEWSGKYLPDVDGEKPRTARAGRAVARRGRRYARNQTIR
jgi:site-specific recombinase XerD